MTDIKPGTELPWFASPYRGQIGSQVWAGTPGPAATLILEEGDASDQDARYIATACNAFPELLEALKRALPYIQDASNDRYAAPSEVGAVYHSMTTAIAKAKGAA
tara:strand:- start:13581 stop:13895 length:315 start_codon:yes stop_codon:yes gene_type:complete